jgi:hypothetical protein
MAEFETKGDDLYIDNHKVIKGWESFGGWYWFATEFVQNQDSVIGDDIIKNDKIWFGFVQGFEEEWGDFSEGEIMSTGKVWRIPKDNLSFSGRRN